MIFAIGTHQPADAEHFKFVCLSINRLERRRKPVRCRWVLGDSGAFTKVNKFGGYPEPPEAYARRVHDLHERGVVRYLAIVAEDYMCEPFVLAKTGLTVADHQRLTVERYDALVAELNRLFNGRVPFHVMPVLQGQTIDDYLRHLAMYGARITPRMWVGVGSVCKRQGRASVVEDILLAIKGVRPDLRLHGFRHQAHGAAKPAGSAAPVQRRQHGVELQRPETGPQRQRLARGHGLPAQGRASAVRARAAAALPACGVKVAA